MATRFAFARVRSCQWAYSPNNDSAVRQAPNAKRPGDHFLPDIPNMVWPPCSRANEIGARGIGRNRVKSRYCHMMTAAFGKAKGVGRVAVIRHPTTAGHSRRV